MLTKLVGFPVPSSVIPTIREATGIAWEFKTGRKGGNKLNSVNAIKVIARALHKLYIDLGHQPTDGLQNLVDLFREQSGKGKSEN
jgi:hypothetical protein